MKAPSTRRKFAHELDEIEYLYYKILFWAYEKRDIRRATAFSDRLLHLLDQFDPKCEAILGASARALIADATGSMDNAIRFRRREIELIEKLLGIGVPEKYDLGPEDVTDRMDLLAIHYWDSGNHRKAKETLEASRDYCRKHRIHFDGQEILDELLQEQADLSRNGRKGASDTRGPKRPIRPKASVS